MAYLVLSRRGETLTSLLLEQERVTVGRDPECELPLDDPSISRHHCELSWNGQHHELTDCSRNGTFLNGERLTDTVVLHDRQRIECGPYSLEYRDGVPERPEATVGNEYQPTLILKYEPAKKELTIERLDLKVALPQGNHAVHQVDHLPITIGSATQNSICIAHDPYISRHHCRIEAGPQGLLLRDNKSRNGTWWQGHQITSQLLPERGAFQVGKTAIEYHVRVVKEPLTPTPKHRCGELFGSSRAMQEIFALVDRVAPSDATILITGESGTGKELLARALHATSGRAPHPFIAINCGAIPATIIESELFGHERGAFTGATTQHRGVFEQAQCGTLVLDEIGDMPLELQTRLLRVLETRQVRRLGGTADLPVDFRLIAATHRNLADLVMKGRFREDLYYRLMVVPIEIPPLRERPEDVLLLSEHFLQALRAPGRTVQLSPPARRRLLEYTWPGNVRELKNTIERALLMTAGLEVPAEAIVFAPAGTPGTGDPELTPTPAPRSLRAHEREIIEEAIRLHEGNLSRAAKALGISRSTLWAKVKHFAVDVAAYRRRYSRTTLYDDRQ